MSLLLHLKSFALYNPEVGLFFATKNRKGSKYKPGEVIIGSDNGCGYLRMRINSELHYHHHLAWLWMTENYPVSEIDHIDGNTKNNKWSNLRESSRAISAHNMKMRSDNSSGVTGVSYKWHTGFYTVTVGKKYLGCTKTVEEGKFLRDTYLAIHPELGYTDRHGK